jgi:hypothetical protein
MAALATMADLRPTPARTSAAAPAGVRPASRHEYFYAFRYRAWRFS